LNAVPDPYSLYGVFFEGSSNSTQTRGFLWQDGHISDLGTLGGPDTLAGFVSDAGQIAGLSYTNSSPNPTTGVPTVDPFFWKNGKMTDIGTLGGVFGLSNRMNNRGQVVGQSDLAGDVSFHAFLWEPGVLQDLGTLGGNTSQAISINESGDVVGVADLPGDATHDAVLWRDRRVTDLGNLGMTSFAFDINNLGQIVGASRLADGTTIHAFLWENGGPMVDLNDLVSNPSDLSVAYAQVINDRGIIAGNAIPAGCNGGDRCQHAFVLIPDGDCEKECEQRLTDHQRERAAAAQLARAQRATSLRELPMTPAESVRNIMRQRFGLPGTRPTLRD
jgi:probable HAF family extracellular repeat protein